MPSADFCHPWQISRGKFSRLPRAIAGFTLCVLDGYGLCSNKAARPTLTPPIRFLFIDSRFCSTLPSDPPHGGSPCASLILHLHQVGWKTFTSKLLNMLGTLVAPLRGWNRIIQNSPSPNYLRPSACQQRLQAVEKRKLAFLG